ncbi:MAG: hypothetical protein R3Y07_05485 [Eubacteriales bacterium]
MGRKERYKSEKGCKIQDYLASNKDESFECLLHCEEFAQNPDWREQVLSLNPRFYSALEGIERIDDDSKTFAREIFPLWNFQWN